MKSAFADLTLFARLSTEFRATPSTIAHSSLDVSPAQSNHTEIRKVQACETEQHNQFKTTTKENAQATSRLSPLGHSLKLVLNH